MFFPLHDFKYKEACSYFKKVVLYAEQDLLFVRSAGYIRQLFNVATIDNLGDMIKYEKHGCPSDSKLSFDSIFLFLAF